MRRPAAPAVRDLSMTRNEGPASNVDVLIAGGNFAGLSLAIALRQALGPSFAVTVADPGLAAPQSGDERGF